MYILQPKLQVMTCCNVRLMYYPGTPILNPPHIQKDNSMVESHRLLCVHSIKMPKMIAKDAVDRCKSLYWCETFGTTRRSMSAVLPPLVSLVNPSERSM